MRTVIVLAVLFLGCVGCTQAPSGPEGKAPDTKANDMADIKALEERFVAAFRTKNVKAIMSVYVPDESLFVFDVSPPRQYVGAAAYTKDWEDLLALFPGPIQVNMTDIDITVGGGDVAYGHSIQHAVGTLKDGKKLDFTVRLTDGYKRAGGQWLIAHEHVSVPVDVLTGKADLNSTP